MIKPTLVILAAGMGSRYGGLKQMDAFGPHGETIIDYSIYDAIQAGFGKVVFIIRDSFKEDFKTFFKDKFEDRIEVEYVTQELSKIPESYQVHPERAKPWGTAHAVQMAKEVTEGPFAVINADDYYGQESYKTLVDFFNSNQDENTFCLVGYYLNNTLSEHGTVNRGVCSVDDKGHLVTIKECTKIKKEDDGIVRYPHGAEEQFELDEQSLVSMNMFGFYPSYFNFFDTYFGEFLEKEGMVLKSEFYIPTLLDILIKSEEAKLKVLESDSDWFGVTYQDDKPVVIEKLNKLIEAGKYPNDLWGKFS